MVNRVGIPADMTRVTPIHADLLALSAAFTTFRARHSRQLAVVWGAVGLLAAALLGVQPSWQSDVVAAMLLAVTAAGTGLWFAATPAGLRSLTAVWGDGLLGQALEHSVSGVRAWQSAGALQPAWQ
jgi:hypothetical protein